MLEFMELLKESYNEDFSDTEKIIKEKWDKVTTIIKEAFDGDYVDKQTAIYRIQNEFTNVNVAPKCIDVDFLNNNLDYVVEKVESLDEGDIRIVINNDLQKGKANASVAPTPAPVVTVGGDTDDIEMESCGKDKKRSKKSKIVKEAEEVPEKTVKITVKDTVVTVEPDEESEFETTEKTFDSVSQANTFADNMRDFFRDQEFELVGDEEPGAEDTEEPMDDEPMEPEAEDTPTDEEPEEPKEEEPKEAEPKDEEPEEKTEEEEDDIDISWEDIEDVEEEEDDVIPSQEENLDLNKLVGKLVKVENIWYSVKEITEDQEIVGVNKEGEESKFTLTQIEAAEYEEEETDEACDKVEDEEDVTEETEEDDEDTVDENKDEPEDSVEEAEEEPEDSTEEEITRGDFDESVMTKYANMFFDVDPNDETIEEESDAMANKSKENNAITAKPGHKPAQMDHPSAPPSHKKNAPKGNYTAKPQKPKETVEPTGTAPKSDKKAAPSGSYTKKPGKPKEKVEKVKSPDIPSEYK